MDLATPFAYGPVGEVLVATDGRCVCVSPEGAAGPLWSYEAAEQVVGVRNTLGGILAVDARGRLVNLARASGAVLGQTDLGVQATGLAATVEGFWAVAHAQGVCLGQARELKRRVNLGGLSRAAVDDRGRRLALGTLDGDVVALDLRTGQRYTAKLKAPITGLAWSRLGWWLITTPHRLYRAEPNLEEFGSLMKLDFHASGGVVSPEGCLFAFRADDHKVAVAGIEQGHVATLKYSNRLVGEIEFGPHPWLGIGIGQGDANRFSLANGDLARSDPPPGHPRNRWTVSINVDHERVRKEWASLRREGRWPTESEEVLEAEIAEPAGAEEGEAADVLPAEAPASVLAVVESDDEPPVRRRRPVEERPPFELASGERVLLRGGFGGILGWIWAVMVLPISLFCFGPLLVLQAGKSLVDNHWLSAFGCVVLVGLLLVAALWPYLRSGKYWLTNQRLHWKPRLGRSVAIPLEEIETERIRAVPLTSSLRIRGRRRVSVRYIRGMERLWGGILLFAEIGVFDLPPESEGLRDVAWWRAYRKEGMAGQLGWAVLRPGYLAFLPSEGQHNYVLELTGAAAGAVVGLHWVTVRAKMPVDLLLQLLASRRPQEFDATVRKTARSFGGLFWEVGEAEVVREENPIQPSRHALVFRDGVFTVRGTPSREQTAIANQLLREWEKEKPIPVRQPMARMVFASVLVTVPALLLLWGGRSMGKGAEADLGVVDPATVLDRQAVPEGSFVTVSGRPDLSHVYYLTGTKRNKRAGAVLVLKEAPNLVLYCRDDQPFYEALHQIQPDSKKAPDPAAVAKLEEVGTVRGRIYEGGEGGAPFTDIPLRDVREFATEELGLGSDKEVRVLVVGMEPSDLVWNSRLAYGFAGVVGAAAALCWLLTARVIARAMRPQAPQIEARP